MIVHCWRERSKISENCFFGVSGFTDSFLMGEAAAGYDPGKAVMIKRGSYEIPCRKDKAYIASIGKWQLPDVLWQRGEYSVLPVTMTNFAQKLITMTEHKNVLGVPLETCSLDPLTGFTREGNCKVTDEDIGVHAVCVIVSEEFLEFSKSVGNDLSTPMPMYGFEGLKPGDRWCLCAPRWKEALDHGMAPPVDLMATHESALEYAGLEDLLRHSVGNDN